jgi:hypothetical protein
MMDHDFSDSLEDGTTPATPPSAQKPKRYDFELPQDIVISDLLAIQLADCARIVRALSDQASDARLEDLERLRTIQSLSDVIKASGDLAECIDRIQGGSGWRDQPSTREKKRKS